MPREQVPGKPTTRRYSEEEKAQAVRLVRQLRAELGTEHGTIQRIADQLGYGVETVRKWVKRADVDEGVKPGRSSEDAARMKALEQENRELKRANEILRRARHASLISGHDSVGVTTGDGVADGVGIGVPLAGVAGTVGDAAGAPSPEGV